MMLASEKLRVVPLTIHMPLARGAGRDQPSTRSSRPAEIILTALARDFGIAEPRLAVAGLNPHAGEDGMLGGEEENRHRAAVAALKARGHRRDRAAVRRHAVPRRSAQDTMTRRLTMYHDQGLIPIKTLTFWDGVNVTLGLPIVRTSPDHGTAFDIAGKGKADHPQHDRGDPDGGGDRRCAGEARVTDDSLPPLRDVIAAHGLAAKKSLGQNFLLDLNLTAQDRARRGRGRWRRFSMKWARVPAG